MDVFSSFLKPSEPIQRRDSQNLMSEHPHEYPYTTLSATGCLGHRRGCRCAGLLGDSTPSVVTATAFGPYNHPWPAPSADLTRNPSRDTAYALLEESHFGAHLYDIENRDTRPGGGQRTAFQNRSCSLHRIPKMVDPSALNIIAVTVYWFSKFACRSRESAPLGCCV